MVGEDTETLGDTDLDSPCRLDGDLGGAPSEVVGATIRFGIRIMRDLIILGTEAIIHGMEDLIPSTDLLTTETHMQEAMVDMIGTVDIMVLRR